ncbi:Xylogalacturonan beta-1,3-xylosyltransferase [Hordeum vulgare]|nr:Xylogalacturonan beta-1,3-xylosyltransferase [Hordeum vulgare]
MQPSSPPEHRRVIRFVTFLALSLLAFSCWALVNSRINNAILIADANKTPLLAGDDDDRHNNGGNHTASIPVAVPSNSDLMVDTVRMGDPVVRETPLAGAGGGEESEGSCDAESALLRVYLYDLPPDFHFGILGWDGKEGNAAWPDVRDAGAVPHYPGGLNLQHSVAYWLTLDILSSTLPHSPDGGGGISRPCVAVRLRGTERVSRNRVLQAQLVKYLMRQDEWRRWGGKDHLVVPYHPNSMMQARKKLSAAMYVLSDFGRYPPDVANLKKVRPGRCSR